MKECFQYCTWTVLSRVSHSIDSSAVPLTPRHRDSRPTHVEMCSVSTITWRIFSAKTGPKNVVTAEVAHLPSSCSFRINLLKHGNPNNCGHGNHLRIAPLTVSTRCRGTSWSYQESDWMLYGHVASSWQQIITSGTFFQNRSQVSWWWFTAESPRESQPGLSAPLAEQTFRIASCHCFGLLC